VCSLIDDLVVTCIYMMLLRDSGRTWRRFPYDSTSCIRGSCDVVSLVRIRTKDTSTMRGNVG
jgi:hypothetical protein